MQIIYQIGDRQVVLSVEPEGDEYLIRLPDDLIAHVRINRLSADVLEIIERTEDPEIVRVFRVPFTRAAQALTFAYAGQTYTFEPVGSGASRGARRAISGALTAPMVGVVVDVLVTEGQRVEAYQPIAAIEAMKVIARVEAPFAGTVRKLHVQPGQRIDHGAPIADIEPEGQGQ
jgi:biotin carboxyl carrier protein